MSKTTKSIGYMVALGLAAALLIGVLVALGPQGALPSRMARWMGLMGYLAVFIAIVSSTYMRELYRLVGRPFLWAHHVVSISGLILLLFHPTIMALAGEGPAIFIPRFDSWTIFFSLGGRVAFYLLGIAALATLLRKRWRNGWRVVHALNYVAFLLATVHAIMIGSNVQSLPVRIVVILMAAVVVWTFMRKRMQLGSRPARPARG